VSFFPSSPPFPSFLRGFLLRLLVDGVIGPAEAVKAYHSVLGRLGVRPHRSLADDLKLQSQAMSYAGNGRASIVVPPMAGTPEQSPKASCACHAGNDQPKLSPAPFPTKPDGLPDFARMDGTQRLAYHRKRLGLGDR